MPAKGQSLDPEQKAKLAAAKATYWAKVKAGEIEHPTKGKAKKQKASAPPPVSSKTENLESTLTEDEAALVAENLDLFTLHQQQIDEAIVAMATGIRIALKGKKTKLRGGEVEYQVDTEAGETWYVYVQPPSPGMARLVREQTKGKAAAREAQAGAATILLKLAIPGIDAEVNHYLAGLPPEHLAKLELDEATLAQVNALK